MMYQRRFVFLLLLFVFCLTVTGSFARSQEKAAGKTTKLQVLVPRKKAKLWINGVKLDSTGKKRLVDAPRLKGGKKVYEVTAIWRTNNYTKFIRTQKVAPRPGKTVVVNLRKADPKNPDRIKIRFVPTPNDVVARMCKLAKIGKKDVIYDLGCGDGRMVINALADFSAKRGVGIDLSKKLVAESKAHAKKRGVADKVQFRVGDVLDVKDLSDASVVMLYMGEDVNLRLRPILKKTLKPGSRIVSHAFGMGDWKPDRTEIFQGDDADEYTIYLWTIK